MSRGLTLVALGSLLVASGCGLLGDGKDRSYRPADPAPVALTTALHGVVRVGLVTSATSAPGEGRDVAPLAEGARVAETRFDLGGKKVELDVRDDQGTAEGARKAVAGLQADGVVGIVYASEGAHVAAGIAAARAAGIAVLLPYAGSLPAGADNAWLTGPSTAEVVGALTARLPQEGLTTPVVDSVGAAATPPALTSGLGVRSTAFRQPSTLTAPRAGATSVVVWADADDSAAAVERLQALKVDLPIVLSPAALSTAFADKLARDGSRSGAATTAGRYLTAGLPTDQPTARSVAFASAVRLTADGSARTSVLNQSVAFSGDPARTADQRSHDAVVVLVRAAEHAGAPTAAGVLAALPGLTGAQQQGLAGPELSFATHEAVPQDAVATLQSEVAPDGASLLWFALPSATANP